MHKINKKIPSKNSKIQHKLICSVFCLFFLLPLVSQYAPVESSAVFINQNEINLQGGEDLFHGTFLARKDECAIYIDCDPEDLEVYINGQKIYLEPHVQNAKEDFFEVDVSPFVAGGENDISITKSGGSRARIIMPCMKFFTELPEKAHIEAEELREIDNVVEDAIKNGITPGAVVLVAKDGNIVKKTAYGLAQKYDMGKLLENPPAMRTDTIFDLASLTKVMGTTQAVMKLISEGKMELDDKVVKYLPAFGKNGKGNITIEDLLTHTSGLPQWVPVYCHATDRKSALDYICNMTLSYAPGSKRAYSDLGFMVLGFVVESITGMPLDEYLEEEIFKPLGMHDTMFNPPENLRDRIAATSWGNPYEYRMIEDPDFGYNVTEKAEDFKGWRNYTLKGEVNDGNAFYAMEGVAGHAGLFSTAEDLAILGQTMLNGGVYGTFKLYDKNVIENFIVPHRFGQGLGWELNQKYMGSLHSPEAFGHTGFTGTQVLFDPVYNLQVIILTNKQNNGQTETGVYPSTVSMNSKICDIVYQAIRT